MVTLKDAADWRRELILPNAPESVKELPRQGELKAARGRFSTLGAIAVISILLKW